MTELNKLAESLNPHERKVVKVLDNFSTLTEIMQVTGLKDVEAMRALLWLSNKGLVKLSEEQKEVVILDENGEKYQKYGLPEKTLLEALAKPLTIGEVSLKTGLSQEEIFASIGALKSKAAIEVKKEKETVIKITDQGKHILKKGFMEENLLKKEFPIETKNLAPEEKFILGNLLKRKRIVRVEQSRINIAELTSAGKKISALDLNDELLEKLTPGILKSGEWKNKKLRRFDVKINVPKIFGGRKHHYKRFLDETRKKFVSLGFKEMTGPIVECDFWDMDALFMPQFHSARDIHQGYYIKEPKYAKDIPEDKLNAVKASHENGFGTGSRGWRYNFDVKRTHRNILRTHDTAVSARTLASKNLKIPGRYFQIARCFRYDVIDSTHLPDFNQVGGFVIEEGINFGHLKSLLRLFAKEFADTTEIRIKPSYFPFTEPSAELAAKHPDLGWIELAGAGIFRPELVKPLVGREIPVIAWGVGLDRLAMFKLGIKDIRNLFSHDLEFLRHVRIV